MEELKFRQKKYYRGYCVEGQWVYDRFKRGWCIGKEITKTFRYCTQTMQLAP